MFVQFKLSELEGQATQPDGGKDKGNSVNLVVDKLVVVVTLEDELVVDIVFPENLNIYSGATIMKTIHPVKMKHSMLE